MANEYFQPGSVPAPNAPGSSAVMRQEFASISAGFDKLPILAGHANKIVVVDGTGTKLITGGTVLGDYVTKDGVFTLTNKTMAWADNIWPGFGTGATKNAGTGAGEVLLLSQSNKLPALDGSLLTGMTTSQISGVTDIAHGGTGASTLGGAQTTLGIDLKADANNAVLTGAPTAPTPPTGDNSARVATTYFVTETLASIGSFAPSNAAPLMNGVANAGVGVLGSRDDHVHPTDTTRAPVNSPTFTGNPTAPTPAVNDNDTSIATTAFVNAEIDADRPYPNAVPLMDGVAAMGTAANVARQDHVHPTDTTRAPINSPTFTGDPRAPTPLTSDNDTSIATTAFVQSLIAQQPPGVQVSNSNPQMNGAVAPGTGVEASRYDHVHPTDTSRAPLVSPAFTGTPTAPTAAPGTNTLQLATTAFVEAARVAVGNAQPAMDGVANPGVSAAASRQDHVHPTDTSRAPASAATAAGTSFTPGGNISAATVQGAIVELDNEKAPLKLTAAGCAFSVRNSSSSGPLNPGADNDISGVPETTRFDFGNNEAGYAFVAPVNGVYQFTGLVTVNSSSSGLQLSEAWLSTDQYAGTLTKEAVGSFTFIPAGGINDISSVVALTLFLSAGKIVKLGVRPVGTGTITASLILFSGSLVAAS